MSELTWDDFREYSPEELIAALRVVGDSLDVVSVEVQDENGNLIVGELVQLHIGYGHDVDSAGGYRWCQITVRREPGGAD